MQMQTVKQMIEKHGRCSRPKPNPWLPGHKPRWTTVNGQSILKPQWMAIHCSIHCGRFRLRHCCKYLKELLLLPAYWCMYVNVFTCELWCQTLYICTHSKPFPTQFPYMFQISFKPISNDVQNMPNTLWRHGQSMLIACSKHFKHMSTHFKHQSQIVHTSSTLVSGTCSTHCQPTFKTISTLFLNHV